MTPPPGKPLAKKITAPEQYAEKIARIPYGFFREQQCIHWKKETGCEIEVNFDGRKRVFRLHGSRESAEKATKLINRWLEEVSTKSVPSATWAKNGAFDYNKWYYDEVTHLENERKQKYLLPPSPDERPRYVAVVAWPEELRQLNITPRDRFGNKLESLRDLRMSHEVYVSLLPSLEVEITGHHDDGVEAAAARYRNLTEHALHSTRNQSLKVNILLDVPTDSAARVLIKDSEPWWVSRAPVPQLLSSPIRDGEMVTRASGPSPEVLHDLRDAIETALEAIRREPGYYELAIRYGSVYLRNVNEKTTLGEAVPVSSFMKAIEGKVFCNTLRCYAPYDPEILQRLMKCEDFLEPTKSGSGFFGDAPESLSETLPSYRTFFIFKDPYSTDQNMVVKIEWTEDEYEDLGYKKQPVRYYRLKGKSAEVPVEKMAANLLELKRSKAWAFSLETMTPYPKASVSPSIKTFAEEVKLHPQAIKNLNNRKPFVTCPKGSKVPKPVRTRLERTYTFKLRDTDYKVDATSIWYLTDEKISQYEPLSALSIRHEDWSTHLSYLETMAPGGDPGWPRDNIVEYFVPDLELLIERLMRLSEQLYATDTLQLPSLGARLGEIRLVDI